jgi:hypothetical protein
MATGFLSEKHKKLNLKTEDNNQLESKEEESVLTKLG